MDKVQASVFESCRGSEAVAAHAHNQHLPQSAVGTESESDLAILQSNTGNLTSDGSNTANTTKRKDYDDDDDDDDDDDNTDQNDDDDKDVGRRRDELWARIQTSREKYKTEDPETFRAFAAEYRSAVEECIVEEKDENEKTILHYLPLKLVRGEFTPTAAHLRLFVKLILDVAKDPKLAVLGVQSGTQKLTCLHYAIDRKQINLVKFICDTADEGALADEIKTKNDRDQNCLHFAINALNEAPDFELFRTLAKKANPATLLEKRSRLDKDDEGAENTPLHDLVHVRMCKTLTRKCLRTPKDCPKCRSKETPEAIAQHQKDVYLDTLEIIADKCKEAMTARNKADQSPYLFHVATRSSTKDTKEWKELEFAKTAGQNGSTKDDVNGLATATAKLPPLAKHKNRGPASAETRANETAEFKPDQLKRRDTDVKTAKKPGHKNPERQYSKPLAMKVVKFLIELCLSQKDFTDACTSLFGKKLPSSELIFKASPLTCKTMVTHATLALDPMLACVELALVRAQPSPELGSSYARQEMGMNLAAMITAREQREEMITEFFAWLRNRGVKRIVKLVVNDDPDFPCKDETIENSLAGFDIRYLDWDKEDLDTRSISSKNNAPNLRELWVSWSGRNSALLGWSNREYGLQTLKQLKKLYITVNPGRESEKRDALNIAAFKEHLRHRDNMPELDVRDPSDTGFKPGSDSNAVRLGAPKEGNNWIEAVDGFVQAVKDTVKEPTRKSANPVTLALIDDGVDLGDLPAPQCVRGGWYSDKIAPDHRSMNAWYFSEKKHGTRMARLIQRVCPYVSLYVGKLDTRRLVYTSVAGSAADAIDKAIKHGANIISMSWTMYETDSGDNEADLVKLKKAIEAAAEKNILLYCACEDSGLYGWKKPYPASIDNVKIKRVGSAGTYGERSDYVNPEKVDYLFPGEIITARDTCSGSSAATALASGLAALILWCAEVHQVKEREKTLRGESKDSKVPQDFNFQKEGRMNGLFDQLRSSEKNPLVNITDSLHVATHDQDPAGCLVELCKMKAHEFFEKKTKRAQGRS